MKKLRFLVSLTTNDNDYQIEQAQSAELMGRKLGVEVRIIYADNDAITQSTQILKAIQSDEELQRPNAIVFEPVGGTALPQVARAAASAGIGWAVLNRDANYVPELRRTSAARDRTAGMQETKPANIHVTLLRAQWTEESSQRAVRSWLKLSTSQRAAIDLVGAQDDSMALGARKAFEELTNESDREQWLRLPFTGCDGLPKTGQAWVRSGLLAATIFVPPNAGQAVEMLFQAMQQGKPLPERALTVPVSIPALEELKRR